LLNRTVARGALQPARMAIRKSLVRRQLHAVLTGSGRILNLDLNDREIDVAALLVRATTRLELDSLPFRRLASAFKRAGHEDAVIDGLSSRDPILRARCLRIAGAMRMEGLVAWIAPLLWSGDPIVRSSAVRALGRIGGARSADALLAAIQRLGPRPMFIIALARAAPDLYLESVLRSPNQKSAHPAAAMAAGIRRRRTATFALMAQLAGGSRRMRVVCSRALGWIGAPVGAQALSTALADRNWRVRMSAAKALGSISTYQPGALLHMGLLDRNPRVQQGARDAIRRLSRNAGAFRDVG
jgi:HEAT repeat protein